MAIFSKPIQKYVLSSKNLPVAIAGCAICCIIFYQVNQFNQLNTQKLENRSREDYVFEELKTKSNLRALSKFPKSGFANLISDWTFLNFLQYFGDDLARKQTGHSASPGFFKVMTNQDPLFLDIYPYLSSSVSIFAGKPQESVNMITRSIGFIPKKLQPQAYFLWQAKAVDELIFLGKSDAARYSYLKVAEWAGRSSDASVQAIAKRSRVTADFLTTNPDSRNARVASWANVLTSAIDDATRHRAVEEIRALGGDVLIDTQGQLRINLPKKD